MLEYLTVPQTCASLDGMSIHGSNSVTYQMVVGLHPFSYLGQASTCEERNRMACMELQLIYQTFFIAIASYLLLQRLKYNILACTPIVTGTNLFC